MNDDLIALLRELADRSSAERDAYFRERAVPASIRAEVESLLRVDGPSTLSLPNDVAVIADDVLLEQGGFDASQRYGSYRPIRLIGRGGMGAVYEA